MQWSANETAQYIKDNCKFNSKTNLYEVSPDDLEKARYAYKNVSRRAMDVGTMVHDAIRIWLISGNEPSNPDDQVLAAFVAFLEFFEQHHMKTKVTEYRFFRSDWSGQLDWYGEFDGMMYLLDWKSSTGHYREHRLQTAAYRGGLSAEGFAVTGHGVLRLDKETGMPDFKDYSRYYAEDWQEFLAAKDLYFCRCAKKIALQFKEKAE